MRITLHTGKAEERYQILCGLVARDMERRQSWSDMVDINELTVQHDDRRPFIWMGSLNDVIPETGVVV